MRNWNTLTCTINTPLVVVFSLPMRNWNMVSFFFPPPFLLVFSLPMRNWNTDVPLPVHVPPGVFSLPMRNWNMPIGKNRWRHPCHGFSAYLWGIETKACQKATEKLQRFQPTYEELKPEHGIKSERMPLSVFSLPMRNWNFVAHAL